MSMAIEFELVEVLDPDDPDRRLGVRGPTHPSGAGAVLDPVLLDLDGECSVRLSEQCAAWVRGTASRIPESAAREAERCLRAALDAHAAALQCAGRLLGAAYDAPRGYRVLWRTGRRSGELARAGARRAARA